MNGLSGEVDTPSQAISHSKWKWLWIHFDYRKCSTANRCLVVVLFSFFALYWHILREQTHIFISLDPRLFALHWFFFFFEHQIHHDWAQFNHNKLHIWYFGPFSSWLSISHTELIAYGPKNPFSQRKRWNEIKTLHFHCLRDEMIERISSHCIWFFLVRFSHSKIDEMLLNGILMHMQVFVRSEKSEHLFTFFRIVTLPAPVFDINLVSSITLHDPNRWSIEKRCFDQQQQQRSPWNSVDAGKNYSRFFEPRRTRERF